MGPSRTGWYVAVQHNDTTRAIMSLGSPAVPELVRSLATANENQATFIILCLRDLHAWSAKDAAVDLLESLDRRFGSRDMTLDQMTRAFIARAQEHSDGGAQPVRR